jgi:hypothetical protein
LERAVSSTARPAAYQAAASPQQDYAAKPLPSILAPDQKADTTKEEIAPETLAVIAAAVTAFLGKKVRIHQARLVNPEVVSPWAQQGRVYVQASHNLGRR